MSIRAAIHSDKTVWKSQRYAAWIPRSKKNKDRTGQDTHIYMFNRNGTCICTTLILARPNLDTIAGVQMLT